MAKIRVALTIPEVTSCKRSSGMQIRLLVRRTRGPYMDYGMSTLNHTWEELTG